jgi:hypothetical protein
MRIEWPSPASVRFDREGVHLRWPEPGAEARYCGTQIPWPAVRDVGGAELRLRDRRTVLLGFQQAPALLAAATEAGVPHVTRAPVWSWLLEPFLDNDYSAGRDEVERDLHRHGFTGREIRRIRWRVGARMTAYNLVVWEWADLDQRDLLNAWRLVRPTPRHAPWWSYRRFRRWTDRVADRGRIP